MLIDSGALRREGDRWVRAEGYGEIAVPPTIKALLEARLDNLARADRATVEPASVIGAGVRAPGDRGAGAGCRARRTIGKHLRHAGAQALHRPVERAQAETIYRFHHHLVRDTVYNGLLKRARANLHLGFVRWADKVNAERDRALEFEEILGYHLEQAYRYLGELGPLDEAGVAIGADAARAPGERRHGARFARGDMHAAANLFRRAVALLGDDDPTRLALLPELGEALMELGDFARSARRAREAEAAAERAGNERLAASAQLLSACSCACTAASRATGATRRCARPRRRSRCSSAKAPTPSWRRPGA